jgi:aromatic-L-amino-acid decarboxylase
MVEEHHGAFPLDWHPEPGLLDFRRPDSREALSELGARAWGLALDYLYDEAMRRPVGPEDYPALRRLLFGDSGGPARAPEEPSSSPEVLREVSERLLPHLFNSQHPRSFSYFTPPPLAMSVAAELLAQWFHQGVDVFHAGPAAALVEEEVVSWLCHLVGFDRSGFGVLTSGGVMANVMALAVARDRHLSRLLGTTTAPRAAELATARVYVSDQAHFSIGRGLDLLGFPPESLVLVESDASFRLQAEPVADAIARDRERGLLPFCIAAVSGSTNTASTDDVEGLASVARAEGLWIHVDAAYGGAARLSRRDAGRVPGLDLADSVTIDPHKWFFQAYDIGALLVRRRQDLRATFHRSPEYYRSSIPETEPLNWLEYSMEGTRRFRALKLWLSWKHLGTEGLGRLVETVNDVAAALAEEIAGSTDFEAAVPVPELSVVCFRHLPTSVSVSGEALDAHQDRLQRALERSGEAWVSTTRLRDRTWLRAGVMNHMTTAADAHALLESLRRLGGDLVS